MNEQNLNVREKAEIRDLLEKRVIVRVWTSCLNPVKPGLGMGHVSIETKNGYISLWPAEPATAADRGKVFPHAFSPDYMSDYDSEGRRKPEYIFCFYSLNPGEIDKAYKVVKETLNGWTMAPYGLNTQNVESCATLAWKMLDIGGIGRLVSSASRSIIGASEGSHGSELSSKNISSSVVHLLSSEDNKLEIDLRNIRRGWRYTVEMTFNILVQSPDSVAAALILAKECELKKYPITEKIKKFPYETNVAEQRHYCYVM